jgi:hypothetical protein
MLRQLALFLGCLAAAGVIAMALSLNGLGPSPAAADPSLDAVAVEPAAGAAAPDAPAASPQVQVDTVYVQPAASPKVVRVVRHAPSATPPPVQREVVVTRSGHEDDHDEGDSEGEDD